MLDSLGNWYGWMCRLSSSEREYNDDLMVSVKTSENAGSFTVEFSSTGLALS